ncbi:alpha/beta hydrolase fold protein [Mycena rebaudengoi]|nr:alpha/beta hydrolase fold protein [Mycena rebaudengoi]
MATTFRLSDGANIFVKVLGDGPGKPLLIVHHGAPGLSSHEEPEASFKFLTDTFRIIVYDARGSGASDLQPPYTHTRWVADIEELRIWAGADKFVLAGGSYGSTQITSGRRGFGQAKQSTTEDFIGWLSGDITTSAANFEGAEAIKKRTFHYATHNAAFSENLPNYDVRSKLGKIPVPTLVVVGRQDLIAPVEFSEEISRGIPGAELAIFEKSGHSPPSDEPEAFQACIRKFIGPLI